MVCPGVWQPAAVGWAAFAVTFARQGVVAFNVAPVAHICGGTVREILAHTCRSTVRNIWWVGGERGLLMPCLAKCSFQIFPDVLHC